MNLLQHKKILVTGASSGIGFAVAKKCVQEGALLICVARRQKLLKDTLKELNSISSQKHLAWSADVGKESEVKKIAHLCRKKIKALDGLVNCAGILGPVGTLDKVSMSDFEKTVRINLLGTAYLCHYFAPLLKKAGGKIINFSGGGGTSPFPHFSAYAASKAGVVRLTENLAEEYRSLGISVNAVAPGFVWTPLHQSALKAGKRAGEFYTSLVKKQKETGGVSPEKAAALVAFLLSAKSNGISGKLISAPFDPWDSEEFREKLKSQKDFATVRRIDDISFFTK